MEAGNIALDASGLRFDPAWQKLITQSNMPPTPYHEDVFGIRAWSEPLLFQIFRMAPYPAEVEETKTEHDGPDGTFKFTVSRFATAAHRAPLGDGEPARPAVLYLHGGGMISCTVETFRPAIARNVAATGVQFFGVDYPRAPEHPAPAAVNAAFEALKWLSSHAAEMGIDPARIIVMGDSAGGGLAAGTAIMARDQGLSPPVAKQVLIYPMLDDRTSYPEDAPIIKFLNWTTRQNTLSWDAYIGADKRGKEDADVSPYAAPGRVESVEGLPSTYIDVGGLDLFRGESMKYGMRLVEANVEVEFHLYPGLPHGFEGGVNAVKLVDNAIENRIRAIRAV